MHRAIGQSFSLPASNHKLYLSTNELLKISLMLTLDDQWHLKL